MVTPRRLLQKHLDEMYTYIRNNMMMTEKCTGTESQFQRGLWNQQ